MIKFHPMARGAKSDRPTRLGPFDSDLRQRGAALLVAVVFGIGLLSIAALTLQLSLAHAATGKGQRELFFARQIADSGAAQALALMKEGGAVAPTSGGWVSFSIGDFLYDTSTDPATRMSVVRAWGRVAVEASTSSSTVAPDDPSWDGTGWLVRGVEVTVQGVAFIPESAVYFGNGGVERPQNGFEWTGGSDLTDPSTWGTVTSSPSSWQAASVPFEASALDHPIDYLTTLAAPPPATSNPHPYQVWSSQTTIGQANTEAWFNSSAGGGSAMSGVAPSTAYYSSDPTSPDYAFPVDSSVPDVQDFGWTLWNENSTNPSATMLSSGSHSGTFGDLTSPGVTFVTGELDVASGTTFEGAGILVIRDDYDPNVDTNNTPSDRALMTISGTFKWTGLVIIAGWAPNITVNPGGDATIVGSLFGEDSVQSGGEISLDSATIIFRVEDSMKVLYSNALFAPGGPINQFLPAVTKQIRGVREITSTSFASTY